MIIEESDFKLIPAKDGSPYWDLELLYEVKSKSGVKKEFKPSGYSYKLETAIKKIINYRIISSHKEEAISMYSYLKEYKKEVNKLHYLLKDA